MAKDRAICIALMGYTDDYEDIVIDNPKTYAKEAWVYRQTPDGQIYYNRILVSALMNEKEEYAKKAVQLKVESFAQFLERNFNKIYTLPCGKVLDIQVRNERTK